MVTCWSVQYLGFSIIWLFLNIFLFLLSSHRLRLSKYKSTTLSRFMVVISNRHALSSVTDICPSLILISRSLWRWDIKLNEILLAHFILMLSNSFITWRCEWLCITIKINYCYPNIFPSIVTLQSFRKMYVTDLYFCNIRFIMSYQYIEYSGHALSWTVY